MPPFLAASPSGSRLEIRLGRPEVRNLELFCKKLEAAGAKLDTPYTQRPDLGIALAFLTDPWGVRIELTEGLNKL